MHLADMTNILDNPQLLKEKIQAKDEEVISFVIRSYKDMVYGIALKILKNEEDAEDAVQNTFMIMYRKIHTYDGVRIISPWLTRIAQRESLKILRRRKGCVKIGEKLKEDGTEIYIAEDNPISHYSSGDEVDEIKNTNPILYRCLKKLKRKEYDCITLYLLTKEKKSYKRISEILNIPEGAVSSHIYRAKEKLKKCYKKIN